MERIKIQIVCVPTPLLWRELQMRILGASSDEIRHRLFQVTSHVLLFHFHAKCFNFHGQFSFLVQSKMVVSAHADIGVFSAYRAGHMRKNLPKPRTYVAVLQTVAYAVAHKVFKVSNDQK